MQFYWFLEDWSFGIWLKSLAVHTNASAKFELEICEGVLECLWDLWDRRCVTNREVTLWYEIKHITGFLIYTCTTGRCSFDIEVICRSCGFVALPRIRSIKVSGDQFPISHCNYSCDLAKKWSNVKDLEGVSTRNTWYQQENWPKNSKIWFYQFINSHFTSKLKRPTKLHQPRHQHLHRCQVHPKDLNDDRYQGTWGQWGLPWRHNLCGKSDWEHLNCWWCVCANRKPSSSDFHVFFFFLCTFSYVEKLLRIQLVPNLTWNHRWSLPPNFAPCTCEMTYCWWKRSQSFIHPRWLAGFLPSINSITPFLLQQVGTHCINKLTITQVVIPCQTRFRSVQHQVSPKKPKLLLHFVSFPRFNLVKKDDCCINTFRSWFILYPPPKFNIDTKNDDL